MSWIHLSLRRLFDDPLPTVATAGLVLVSAFMVAAAPGVLGRVADDALRQQVRAAAPLSANFELLQAARLPAGPSAPLAAVAEEGSRLLDELPASVRSIAAEHAAVVETPRWAVTSATGAGTLLAIRIQEDADSHVRIVEGRAPTAATEILDAPAQGVLPAGTVVALEAMIAVPSVSRMGVSTGDVLLLAPDLTDPLARGRQLRLAVRIVGTFDVIDEDAPFWLDDRTVAGPSLRSPNADTVLIDVTALVSPDVYPALVANTDEQIVGGIPQTALPFRYKWRSFVDPDRLTAEAAPGLLADLRRAETIFPSGPDAAVAQSGSANVSPFSVAGVPPSAPTSLATGLPRVLASHLEAWGSAAAVLTVGSTGPTGIAIATLGLVAALAATRRKPAVTVWYRRGARRRQVVAAVAAEVLLVGLPAAVAGVAVALLVAPGEGRSAVALGTAVLVVAILLSVGATLLATSEADPSGVGHQPGPARRRRLRVLEALVIGLAIASAALVRERGVSAAQDRLLGIDPLVAGAPVLMGFAVAIVTWHVARVGLRALAGAARRRPGLVPVLAFRRSTRGTGSGMILAVLLTTAAIAAFSLAGAGQITASTRAAAWQAVGADYLVEGADGRPLAASAATTPSSPEPAASGSVAAVPLEAVFPGATVVSAGYRDSVPIGLVGDQADLLALDPAYQRLVAGTPIEPSLPPGVLDSVADSRTDPLPGIVSSSLTIAQEPVAAGDTVVLSVGARRVPVHVIAVRETFPSLPEGDPFVVVSLPGLEQAVSSPLARSRIYLRAPEAAAPALRREIAATFSDGLIRDRASLQAAFDGAPLPRAVSTGLTLAAVAAVAYAALAVVAALTLAGASRGVEAAHLRALGMSRRQQVQVVLLEYLPIVALAFAVGIAAGFAFFIAVQPGLHVASLAGTTVESPPAVDAGQTLGLLFGLTLTAIAAILAGTLVEQRTSPASTARRSLE